MNKRDEASFSDLEDLCALFEDCPMTTKRRVWESRIRAARNVEREIARIERGYALPEGSA